MIKRIKKFLTSMAVFGMVFAPVAAPAVVYAQDDDIREGLCAGIELEPGQTCADVESGAAERTITGILETVINLFSLVVGVVSVIMIIVGGLKYITSGGDSGNVSGAKNTILYAVIGLVVVALAQFIVRFVLGRVGTAGQ